MAESSSETAQNGLTEIKEKSTFNINELQEAHQPRESSDWKPDRIFYLAIVSICAGTFMTGIAATSFVVIIPVSAVAILNVDMADLADDASGYRI